MAGLAAPRAGWFRNVSQWCTAGSVPVRFLKCLSAEEIVSRLKAGPPLAGMLVEEALPGVDRDLLSQAREAGCAVVVVGRGKRVDWLGLGASCVLAPDFDAEALMSALRSYCKAPTRGTPVVIQTEQERTAPSGRVVVVCSPGGCGASTAAIAIAQGLATSRRTVLADFARRAEQAMLHDAGTVTPGIQELAASFRLGRPTTEAVRDMTFEVPGRNYRLLLGLRTPYAWTALPPKAFLAAFEELRAIFDLVVADVDADFESEAQCGSIDVEERNLMARSSLQRASVVVVVGRGGVKGMHSLVRTVSEVIAAGSDPRSVLSVCNDAPRNPLHRSELNRAFAKLAQTALGDRGSNLGSLLFLPHRDFEAALRDGSGMPTSLVGPLSAAVSSLLSQAAEDAGAMPTLPRRVTPGRLGHWADLEDSLGGAGI